MDDPRFSAVETLKCPVALINLMKNCCTQAVAGRPLGAFSTFKAVYNYYKYIPTTIQEWSSYVNRGLQENSEIQCGNNVLSGWDVCILNWADGVAIKINN